LKNQNGALYSSHYLITTPGGKHKSAVLFLSPQSVSTKQQFCFCHPSR